MFIRFHAFASLVVLVLAGGLAPGASLPNAFFAMDTGTRDDRHRTFEAQAALLKRLGYDGYGGSGLTGLGGVAQTFEQHGLKLFNVYVTMDFDSARPALSPQLAQLVRELKGHDSAIWLAINRVTRDGVKLRFSDPAGDDVVVPPLRALAALAASNGVRVALYPHAACWAERVEDNLRVANRVNAPNLGVTFNLCHWLKVEGDRDPAPMLREALPRLFFVSINGADSGDTKSMNWDRLIQTLDRGTYDNARLLGTLKELGYTGPVGLQAYGIKGDVEENLRRSMGAWRRLTGRER